MSERGRGRKAGRRLDEIGLLVDAQAKAAGWGIPEREYKFCPTRKWKADYFWGGLKMLSVERWFAPPTALEVEGGVFIGGRHTRGAGFLKDCEKYNTMAAMGIRLIRLTPQQVRRGELQTWLEKMR